MLNTGVTNHRGLPRTEYAERVANLWGKQNRPPLHGDERRQARGTTPFRNEPKSSRTFSDGARGCWRDPAAL